MMPMADLFAPDINFSSARSVYPTSNGGTTAGAASAMSATTNTVAPDANGNPTATTMAAPVSLSGHTVYWWLGTLAFLAAMVFVARRAGGAEDFRNIRPTGYNFATIVLTAVVGIVMLKVLAVKFRVPGISDLILAV